MSNSFDRNLNTKDIKVGDKLIRADWSFHWGSSASLTESVWTVAKVLKTRLVVERRLTNPDGTFRTIQTRVLVESGAWAEPGRVKPDIEGQSEWSRDRFYLFTPDDKKLNEIRNEVAKKKEEARVLSNTKTASVNFQGSPSIEAAESAIQALKAFIAFQKETNGN